MSSLFEAKEAEAARQLFYLLTSCNSAFETIMQDLGGRRPRTRLSYSGERD